jgi:putative dehydrogenase
MADTTVGVVGLGAMGMGAALALIDAGFNVFGFDVDAAKLSALNASGGTACESPAALAEHTDRVITLVVNAEQVEQALFGERGLAASFSSGLLIQPATAAPGWVCGLDKCLDACGIELLDSPVSGGQLHAREGKLSVMLSGPAARRARRRYLRRACRESVCDGRCDRSRFVNETCQSAVGRRAHCCFRRGDGICN